MDQPTIWMSGGNSLHSQVSDLISWVCRRSLDSAPKDASKDVLLLLGELTLVKYQISMGWILDKDESLSGPLMYSLHCKAADCALPGEPKVVWFNDGMSAWYCHPNSVRVEEKLAKE